MKKFSKGFTLIFITLMMIFSMVFVGCGGGAGDPPPPEPTDFPWTFDASTPEAEAVEKLNAQRPVDVNGAYLMSFSNDISLNDDNEILLANSRYLVIGSIMTSGTTATKADPNGQLDLSQKAKITIEYSSATPVNDPAKQPGEGFQILVNNNTSGGANSVLGSDSRIRGSTTDEGLVAGGGTVEAIIDPADFANHASLAKAFITLRSASGSSVVISKITIDYVTDGVPVTGVAIRESDITGLENGDTVVLHADFTPANASNQAVTWASSIPAVATVDELTGLVTAVADTGTTVITVTTTDGGFTDSINVSVVPAEVAQIDFDVPYALTNENIAATEWMSSSGNWGNPSGEIGDYPASDNSYQNLGGSTKDARFIEMTVSGVTEVSFDVSNPNDNGRGYLVKIGDGELQFIAHSGSGVERSTFVTGTLEEVTIRISCDGQNKTVYPLGVIFRDEVSATPPAEYVAITGNAGSLVVGSFAQLSAFVIPNNADQAVTWGIVDAASKSSIATIDATGKLTAGNVEGTVTVTATANGTEIVGELEVEVSAPVMPTTTIFQDHLEYLFALGKGEMISGTPAQVSGPFTLASGNNTLSITKKDFGEDGQYQFDFKGASNGSRRQVMVTLDEEANVTIKATSGSNVGRSVALVSGAESSTGLLAVDFSTLTSASTDVKMFLTTTGNNEIVSNTVTLPAGTYYLGAVSTCQIVDIIIE
jgi:uncharacterized protein YjdB